jgi:uncharacterized membrane protein (UPF0127 family)
MQRWWLVWGLLLCTTVQAGAQWAVPRGEVVFPDATRVSVEIADTPALRERGLMFRRQMARNEGMVFVFDDADSHPFWMKNTLIPLDIIWLDGDRRVLWVAHSVPPCAADPCPSYAPAPTVRARYVVEVSSGVARAHGLEVGDVLQFTGVPLTARPSTSR